MFIGKREDYQNKLNKLNEHIKTNKELCESIIEIDEDGNEVKTLKSNMGGSFLICNGDNIDDLSKSESTKMEEQNTLARYKKTKKIVYKGSEFVARGNAVFNAVYTVYKLSKYVKYLPYIL
uniref:Uncharacterized protein n=1 Tax=Mimivirus LCMiAC01 TaxID=2506608 RepID=A0A481Z071_9VIRU|nr:MAG: hypothetical protein LCMiAC01_05010 [Mimivirus LCMiAC01]